MDMLDGLNMPKLNQTWQEINILLLAYLGDGVYELWVRKHLLEQGIVKVEDMHKKAVFYVQAKTQAAILKNLMDILNSTETEVVYRGRNTKGHYPRYTDVITYRHATAFESLIGYWYVTGQRERMNEILAKVDSILQSLKDEEMKSE